MSFKTMLRILILLFFSSGIYLGITKGTGEDNPLGAFLFVWGIIGVVMDLWTIESSEL